MFGFIGKHQGQLIAESAGSVSGSTRNFFVRAGGNMIPHVLTNPFKEGFLIFDLDSASPTNPDEVWADLTTNAYGKEAWSFLNATMADQAQISNRLFDESALIPLGETIGWKYTSSAALIPTTRKFKVVFVRPEFVETIVMWPVTNNQSRTADSNTATGTLDLVLDQFSNLVAFSINEAWISTLNLKAQNLTKLKYFELRELLNISAINGRLPICTERIKICTLSAAITSINDLISLATACKTVQLGHYSPSPNLLDALTTLTGTLELSHMTALEELAMSGCSSLSSISFPAGNPWRIFHVENSDTAFGAIANTYLDAVLACSTLVYFGIHNNGKTWAKNFANADISPVMLGMHVYGNSITGNFIKTDSQLVMKELILGLNQNETNAFSIIDLSGFSGGSLTRIHIQGVACEDLQLPVSSPSLTELIAYDNKLDIVTNSDIISKLNAYTALVTLQLGRGPDTTDGQVSVNGLGANPDFSALNSLATLYLNDCGFSGALTLPTGTALSTLVLDNNNFSSIVNLSNKANLLALRCENNPLLDLDISGCIRLRNVDCSDTGIVIADHSGKSVTNNFSLFQYQNCPNLTELYFPTGAGCASLPVFVEILNCTSLTVVGNLDNITNNDDFYCNGCSSLNQTFPLGQNSWLPTAIGLQGLAMNSTNIDATIDLAYTNRAKWIASVGLDISGGTNAAPTGVYQAPAGFILGSNDGTPANANEQIYVLVQNYGWVVTTN